MRALVALLLVSSSAEATKRPVEAPPIETVAAALGVEIDQGVELDDHQREIAHRAGARLVSLCPDCRLATIGEEGPCGWARTQRLVIKSAAAKGMSEDQIVATYVKTYGPDILALAEDSALGIFSWSVPYALCLAGLVLVFVVARKLRRNEPSPMLESASTEDRRVLDRALQDLD